MDSLMWLQRWSSRPRTWRPSPRLVDQGGALWLVDLAAQTLNHDVDHVRHRFKRRVPYVLGDRAASNDLAGVEDEKFQERELTRCQSDDLVVSTSFDARGDRVRDCPPSAPRGYRQPAATNQGAQASQQLAEVERFDQVVVCSAVEVEMRDSTASLAVSIRTGTSSTRRVATPPADFEPVHRQHHVQDDGVIFGDRRLVERVPAVVRDIDRACLLAQPLREHLRSPRFILDQQHFMCQHSQATRFPNRTNAFMNNR